MPSITPPQIESYFYAGLNSLNVVRVREGIPWFTFTLPSTMTAGEALDYWAAQANAEAGLAGTYTFAWRASTQQVQISSTVGFEVEMRGSLSIALGFSTSTQTGASLYRSDVVPLAIANPKNIDYDPPWAAEETELKRYRWGRIRGRAHFRALLTRVELLMTRAQTNELLSGPLLQGKFRAYPCGYTANAYAADNLRGYLDVFPYAFGEGKRIGSGDSHALIAVTGSMDT